MQAGFARLLAYAVYFGIFSLMPQLVLAQAQSSSASYSDPAYGGCVAPAQSGVQVCGPTGNGTAIGTPVQVIAAATGGRGPVARVELWVDGKKLAQAAGNVFDQPVNLIGGPQHTLTLVEVDTTGYSVSSAPVSVYVQYSTKETTCPPPGSPGVNVCSPLPNQCSINGYYNVLASGTAASGHVLRMELWLNNTKLANFPGNTINTNLPIFETGTITIIEVDSNGGYIKSAPIPVPQAC